MTKQKIWRLAGVVIGITGFVFLWDSSNWGVALGVLLMIWGNSIERMADRE
jgi:hypothetical protein